MLESYFEAAHTLTRLRSGPTGPFIDTFADWLRGAGYAHTTMRSHLRAAAHVGAWMALEGLTFEALDEEALEKFEAHLSACACFWRSRGKQSYAVDGARRFLDHLQARGVVRSNQAWSVSTPSEIVERFEHWMRRHRGVTASTLTAYRLILSELVHKVGGPEQFTTTVLRSFVSERAARHGRSRAKTVISAVRMFVRYLVAHGLCEPVLADAIPAMAHWRLSSLPVYLPPEDVERIVGAPDTATPMGRRDRAILLLLARLGLRAGDVTSLRLDDLAWDAGMLRVGGKERRASKLPLPQEVGDAILAYFSDGRPDVADDHVFLRVRAPVGELRSSSAVSSLVGSAAKKAGVKMPPRGRAHVLRHSVATALVRGGAPLSAVRILLRHRSEDTTAHYAKVDFPALRRIARPWPLEVSSC